MPTQPNNTPGTLYVVATPIGNLEDITFRAVRILGEVTLIAAEDTRHTRKLLNHYGINTPLISYYREKELSRADELIARLQAGDSIALVSDAGTPAISDPGALLVQQAHHAGLPVVPVPGPSALTATVSVAGSTQGAFMFVGFAPAKSSQRRKLLTSLASSSSPVVFYESPRRVRDFLADALAVLGDRPVLLARELTKTFEEIRLARLSALVDGDIPVEERGEFVLMIWPTDATPPAENQDLASLLLWYRDHSGLSLKDACRQIAADLNQSRSVIYQQALAIWHSTTSE